MPRQSAIKIGKRVLSRAHAPFIIAELSGNHSQNYEIACEMVDVAAKCGVDAIKLQTYTADSMTLNIDTPDFTIREENNLWSGEKLHGLYQKAATPYQWHKALFERAKSHGIEAFSSPFDAHAVDFLDDLNVPCFKIASFELTDLPLIAHAASKGKPLIMSTGMASLSEIEVAISCAKKYGAKDIILLKCTSTYPALPENTNLITMETMRDVFGCQVGLSDHTKGIGVSIASVALGASVIEKHFVLDRSAGGVDATFSLEPDELKSLVDESKRAWASLGEVTFGGTPVEEKSKQYRRSIYVKKPIAAGELFSAENLQIVRPAFGLSPKYWWSVVDKYASCDLAVGTPLAWEHISS